MARAGKFAAERFVEMLTVEGKLAASLRTLALVDAVDFVELNERQVVTMQMAAELQEKTAGAQYPSFHIYCEQVKNLQREKFRTFSGTAQLVVDVRVSQDRMQELDAALHRCVDAVTDVLDNNRGDWGRGVYYTGGYEVKFEPIKHGGRNFLQSAEVSFIVNVSM